MGRDRVLVFEPAMQEAAETRFELESELRRAIDQSEFVLNYQPIVTCRPVNSSGRRPSFAGTIRRKEGSLRASSSPSPKTRD